jgi:hypothetical protein
MKPFELQEIALKLRIGAFFSLNKIDKCSKTALKAGMPEHTHLLVTTAFSCFLGQIVLHSG